MNALPEQVVLTEEQQAAREAIQDKIEALEQKRAEIGVGNYESYYIQHFSDVEKVQRELATLDFDACADYLSRHMHTASALDNIEVLSFMTRCYWKTAYYEEFKRLPKYPMRHEKERSECLGYLFAAMDRSGRMNELFDNILSAPADAAENQIQVCNNDVRTIIDAALEELASLREKKLEKNYKRSLDFT